MKSKDFFLSVVLGALFTVAFFFLVEYSGALDHILPQNSSEKPYLLASAITGAFAALAIHELGHLLTALSLGFRFQLFVVGFLGIKRTEDGKIRIYFNTDPQLFGGVAAAVPADVNADNKRKFAWVLIAGPLASLIAGLLFVLISSFIEHPARMFFGFTGFISLALFLATTIPNRSGAFFTDRARFQRLMKRGKAGEVEAALLELTALHTAKKSSRDFDLRKIELIKSDKEPVMQYVGYAFAYDYYSELGDEENARIQKERMTELSSKLPKGLVKLMEKR